MFSRVSRLAMAGVAAVAAFGVAAHAQPNLTKTCAFREGPRARQTVNYAGAPGAVAVPVGQRCADMQGSSGTAVAQGPARRQALGRYYTSPGAPSAFDSAGDLKRGFTLTCRFDSGPRAGTRLNFAHTLGAQPVAVGAPCADAGSRGVGVASGP